MHDTNSLQSQAYQTIKDKILSKELDTGTMYSETRMARELGISRTPLREALQCLSQDGYLTIIPSRGFRIRQLDRESMRESIQVRCAIEGFCIHLTAACEDGNRLQGLLKDMEKSLKQQKSALSSKDFPGPFTEADHQFHLLLVHFAQNTEFDQLFQRLMYMIHLTTANALTITGRAKTTYEEHLALYRHLRDGDVHTAYQVLMAHLMMPLDMNIV